ncbi:MAG: hypothetical protein LBT38_00910 [Deltaproteobacteria bacterium]|nr:hypothetical protein [Deltaproteobacteria bacterium]
MGPLDGKTKAKNFRPRLTPRPPLGQIIIIIETIELFLSESEKISSAL